MRWTFIFGGSSVIVNTRDKHNVTSAYRALSIELKRLQNQCDISLPTASEFTIETSY
jgi:hypothetical protein